MWVSVPAFLVTQVTGSSAGWRGKPWLSGSGPQPCRDMGRQRDAAVLVGQADSRSGLVESTLWMGKTVALGL